MIENSEIENTYIGVESTPSDGSPFGGLPTPTIVKNTTLKNFIDVQVGPQVDGRLGDGNYLDLNDDEFALMSLPSGSSGTSPRPSAYIDMNFAGTGDARDITKYSIVMVNQFQRRYVG